MKSAADLDFGMISNFDASEFPGRSLEYVADKLIVNLDYYRSLLGSPVTPSPVKDGWYRLDGSKSSRHYAVGTLSDAGDIFPKCDIRDAFLTAVASNLFGGIGVYLDTKGPSGNLEPMLHLDLRPKRPFESPLIWLRNKGQYIYPASSNTDKEMFWRLLGSVLPCSQDKD